MKVKEIWRKYDESILFSVGALLLTCSLHSCRYAMDHSRIQRSRNWPTIKYIWDHRQDSIAKFGEEELPRGATELEFGAYLRRVWELNPDHVKRTKNEGDFSFSFWGEVPVEYTYEIEDGVVLNLPDVNGDGKVGSHK